VITLSNAVRVRPLIDSSSAIHDAEELRRRARTHGYVFARNLVSRATVRRLRAAVLERCARRGWLRHPWAKGLATANASSSATPETLNALQPEVQVLPVFSALRSDPALMAALERLFGATPAAGCGDVCRVAFPNATDRTTPPHQDQFYLRSNTPIWTAWIPLGDCPGVLGGLAVLPGSHTAGLLPHDAGDGDDRCMALPDDTVWAGASYRCGDVLLLNVLTVHRARPNLTADRVRVSIDCRYRAAS
jgi:ectoine hydroxylase-related dioxygenase (phytanoyl-CoA dioxygenase family)